MMGRGRPAFLCGLLAAIVRFGAAERAPLMLSGAFPGTLTTVEQIFDILKLHSEFTLFIKILALGQVVFLTGCDFVISYYSSKMDYFS